MSMTQTGALLLDAYRELNARKMFWITLILSGVVVLAFAAVGLNERGIVLLFWTLESDILNAQVISPPTFYRGLFTGFGVGIWLTWAAAILALISTATIFPDLVSAGSIDLILSKPIGRLRLFITKFIFGLLFVALQVTIFTVASFFVLGFRGDMWDARIFWAIPIVLIFFSYLFSVCAVLGVITRSTIAALLLTLLFWFVIFLMHTAETGVLMGRLMGEQRLSMTQRMIEGNEGRIEMFRSQLEADHAGEGNAEDIQRALEQEETLIKENRKELERHRARVATWGRVHTATMVVKTLLPKTTETVELLDRYLIEQSELDSLAEQTGGGSSQHDISMQMEGAKRQRSVNWIIGTSIIFELFILMLGAWIFCRRDF